MCEAVKAQFGSPDASLTIAPLDKLMRCPEPMRLISDYYSNPRFSIAQTTWTSWTYSLNSRIGLNSVALIRPPVIESFKSISSQSSNIKWAYILQLIVSELVCILVVSYIVFGLAL